MYICITLKGNYGTNSGIYFDVNSDKLKPESTATIKEIAKVLNDNPAEKISIAGHTDNDGDDALNLDFFCTGKCCGL